MQYSVVIRTLGKVTDTYIKTLRSLMCLSIPPSQVLIYIAEGYPIPSCRIGMEQYIYVPKGMVAQRALSYKEVETEYCLFLDDDVYLPPDSVDIMYSELIRNSADVISPCTFLHHNEPLRKKIISSILGKEVCRVCTDKWGFKVLKTAGFSYKNNPTQPVYLSQTNAGPCFFCRKDVFLQINYDEERWLDKTYYALPDDQVMFYKMYKRGLKILTTYDTGVIHLDASSTIEDREEKTIRLTYSEYRNKLIFWHRFLFLPEKNVLAKTWAIAAISYAYCLQAIKHAISYLVGHKAGSRAFFCGVKDALNFLRSDEYKKLPLV